MSMESIILGMRAETSIHAGTGQNLGVIDLPIEREAHTQWPCVYGSGVKGALRSKAGAELKKNTVEEIFGPENIGGSNSAFAGALIVGDARLLLLPVRSLTSHFKWVTCPAILKRLQADYRRLGKKVDYDVSESIKDENAIIFEKSEKCLFLEEFSFTPDFKENPQLVKALVSLMSSISEEDLKKQLVIVSDDMFNHLSCHATPVCAHIAINNETKTVKPGALWYEETLPPDTIMYCTISANKSRAPKNDEPSDEPYKFLKSEDVLDEVRGLFEKPYLQVGGNETVGMGWFHINILEEK